MTRSIVNVTSIPLERGQRTEEGQRRGGGGRTGNDRREEERDVMGGVSGNWMYKKGISP